MKTVQELLWEVSEAFRVNGVNHPKQSASDLLCDLLDCSRAMLVEWSDRLLTEQECFDCQHWAQRRLNGEPLAYISGKVQFYDCDLLVDSHVLIPRQETEILVDTIVQFLEKEDVEHKILWDICCGSGCIGIALKKKFPSLQVALSDQSKKALEIAARNAKKNAVEVVCLHGDLLEPFHKKKAHYVVCNPPYISEEEYRTLEREVKEFEPSIALLAGKTGFEFYQRLAGSLPSYLHPQGKVWLEIGCQQGPQVEQIFSLPSWKKKVMENDWAGHNRFFFLENE